MENIKQFISQIVSGDNIAAKQTFNELVSERSMEALAARKQEISSKLFQTEGKKEWSEEKEEDEKEEQKEEVELDEKALSTAQQKFMGMVYAAKKGMKPASPEVAKAAEGMTKKQAHDFAATKHKGLPSHVDSEK